MSDTFGGQIHYRCAFDATCVTKDWTDPYGDLLKRVRGWAERVLQVPPNNLKRKKFFLGGSFRDECPPRTSFETLFRNYNEEGMPPSFWGCRLRHQCSEFPHRTWCIDITIATRGHRGFRLVLVNRHTIRDYLGEEPESPEPTAPGIVQSLVTSKHWRCTSGTELLNGRPVTVFPGRMDLVKQSLANQSRTCPIVYVTRSSETGKTMLDEEHLAKVLSGTAVVYVAESPEVDIEVEHLFGQTFGTRNGGIRIYQPRVNFEAPSDARRHRFFSITNMSELGSDEVTLQIVRACCRRAPVIVSSDVSSIDDIASAGRRRRLRELASSQAPTDSAELEELIAAVDEDNTKLREELEEERLLREMDREQKDDELAKLRFEYGDYKHSTQGAFERIQELESRTKTLASLQRLPESLEETLKVVHALRGDKLCLTDDALETSRNANFGDLRIAWGLLWSLAEVLHPMLFDENVAFSDADYKNKTGFSLAMSEGTQTQRDDKLMRLRQKSFRGRAIDVTPHVGFGSGKDCLRVYFAIDKSLKKIIIGHCGNHLDNWTTKKRK